MSLLHVRQVETYLRSEYGSEPWVGPSEQAGLSRMLARYAVDLALGDSKTGGPVTVEVTDDSGDGGIDAVAVDPLRNLVVVAQSKWRRDGSGSVDLGAILKFVRGVRSLLDIESAGIRTCSPEVKTAVRKVMESPGGRLKIVVATTAANALSPEVSAPLVELLQVLNEGVDSEPIAELAVYVQQDLHDAVAKPAAADVELEVQLLDWGRNPEPVPSYYGRVVAAQVADWYVGHGANLFADNIRVVLPNSDINDGILRTVRNEPDRFWYYNNGITILARKIERSLAGSASRDAIYLKLRGASIVNGAQTASTLGRGRLLNYTDGLERAYVSVRMIEVFAEDAEFPRYITRYANTQNVVSSQDFVFLDQSNIALQKN